MEFTLNITTNHLMIFEAVQAISGGGALDVRDLYLALFVRHAVDDPNLRLEKIWKDGEGYVVFDYDLWNELLPMSGLTEKQMESGLARLEKKKILNSCSDDGAAGRRFGWSPSKLFIHFLSIPDNIHEIILFPVFSYIYNIYTKPVNKQITDIEITNTISVVLLDFIKQIKSKKECNNLINTSYVLDKNSLSSGRGDVAKKLDEYPADIAQLVMDFDNRLAKQVPGYKIAQPKDYREKWAAIFQTLIDRHNISVEQLTELNLFLNDHQGRDGFRWGEQVRSPNKLLKKKDGQIYFFYLMQYAKSWRKNTGALRSNSVDSYSKHLKNI